MTTQILRAWAARSAWRRLETAASLCILLVACGCGKGASTTPPIVSISVSPSTANVGVGQTVQFVATVTNAANTTVTWKVNGKTGGDANNGAISAAGLYTAPVTMPAQPNVSVTAIAQADTTKSAAAGVTITGPGPVAVVPATATVAGGATQTFSATLNGLPTSAVDWQVEGITGGDAVHGTISANGDYTAPAIPPAGGSVVITAVDHGGAGSGTAQATIGFSNLALNGSYVFHWLGTASGKITFVGAAGNLVADGGGQITGGNIDQNSLTSQPNSSPITGGRYTIGLDGRGFLRLQSAVQTFTLQIAMASDKHGVFLRAENVATASGSIDKQEAVAFSTSTLSGIYSASLRGVDANQLFFQQAAALQFDGSGKVTGILDGKALTGFLTSQPVSGTYTMMPTGQGTLSITTPGYGSQNFAIYAADGKSFRLVETETSPAVVGDAVIQPSGALGPGLLQGTYAFLLSGYQSNASAYGEGGFFDANGSGQFTFGVADLNSTNNIQQGLNLNDGAYNFFSGGRGTGNLSLSNGENQQYAMYPRADGTLVMLEIDKTHSALGLAYLQDPLPLGTSTLLGGFVLRWHGNLVSLIQGVQTTQQLEMTGQLTTAGAGTAAGNLDFNLEAVPTLDVAATASLNVGSTGRGTMTVQSANGSFTFLIYAVGANTALVLDVDPGQVLTGTLERQF